MKVTYFWNINSFSKYVEEKLSWIRISVKAYKHGKGDIVYMTPRGTTIEVNYNAKSEIVHIIGQEFYEMDF
jgi:hypothetical protein